MAGALHRPNGMTLNWYSPFLVTNAVLGRSFSSTSTCQYPEAKSRAQKYSDPARVSYVSSMWGRGKESFRVRSFSFR